MTSDPYTPTRISVTIKVPESAKWAGDNPWLVFEGSSPAAIRDLIIEAFDLQDTEGLNLFEVALNAERVAINVGGTAQKLGGTVLKQGTPAPQPAGETPANSSGDVWSQAAAARPAAQEAKPPADPILTAIEGCADVGALQQVWAENQTAFNENPSYMDAYKAKGKALTAN